MELDYLDLQQIQNVLSEISCPSSPLESSWNEFADILTSIKKDCDLTLKLSEILNWIIKHPSHTFPTDYHGWVNVVSRQFRTSNASKIVSHMIQLDILTVRSLRKSKHHILSTRVDHKRCREMIDDSEENKRYRKE
jgi:hypothetical protein